MSTQTAFDWSDPVKHFDGETYEPKRDRVRLTGQLARVFYAMRGAEWTTLRDLADLAQGSEAGVSARLRDLRKQRFGGHTIERRRVTDGLWEYRMLREGHE